MSEPQDTSKTPPFVAWLDKNATVPVPTIAAARKALTVTEAAVSIAKQLFPDGKFSTANVMEIARLIFDYEMDDFDEDPGEDDPEPDRG